MDLVLLRHGPAQDPAGRADYTRELTAEGRALVVGAANSLAYILRKAGQPVSIWTSPLVRTRQTADILAAALQVPATEKTAIAEGQLESLARDWQTLPSQGTLVLVGHEPHLSQWGGRIAATLLPIEPAAAAAFALDTNNPLRGRLLWFAQADILGRWGR